MGVMLIGAPVIVPALSYLTDSVTVHANAATPLNVHDLSNNIMLEELLRELKRLNTYMTIMTDEEVKDLDIIEG